MMKYDYNGAGLMTIGKTQPVTAQKGKGKPALFMTLTFALAFLCVFAVFRFNGLGFNGERSILISDMYYQYIDFFTALRNGTVVYTTGLGLGGDFLGTYAYYLASPFSLVVFLFPVEKMQAAVLLIVFLKVAASAASFTYMLYRLYEKLDIATLAFSLCYALMSYVFFFFINVFWFDALVWLPLLAVSTVNLVETGKMRWTPLLLAALFISNFYISYMTGLFLLLFVLYLCARYACGLRQTLVGVAKLAASAVIAALMSAVLLLPVAKNYAAGAGIEVYSGYQNVNFTPRQFLLKLFNGYFDSIGNYAAPTIFCGVAIFLLVAAYFFIKSISIKEKLVAGAVLVFMLASFYWPKLDIIWHAFAYPNAFAYRYAFCFSFLLVFLAYRAFAKIDEVPAAVLWGAGGVALLLGCFSGRLLQGVSAYSFAATLAAWILYPLLLLVVKKARQKRFADWAVKILSLIVVAELCLNGFLLLRGNDIQNMFPDYDDWLLEREAKSALLLQADGRDTYRIADTDRLRRNQGAALAYNGVSISSSNYSPALLDFYGAMGYDNAYKSGTYQPAGLIIDSILGIRYVITEGDVEYMQYVTQQDEYRLYYNEYALPIAFCARAVGDYSFGANTVHNQKQLLWALTGNRDDPAEQLLSQLQAGGMDVEVYQNGHIEGIVTAKEGCVLQTTLPYDRNYVVRVDGNAVDTYEVFGCLMAVDLSAGTHHIEIRYQPKELYVGAGISILSCGAYMFFQTKDKRRSVRYSIVEDSV